MRGLWRVLVVMVCGALMALAALAGQVGYNDNYGRTSLHDMSIEATAGHRYQVHDLTLNQTFRKGVEKL